MLSLKHTIEYMSRLPKRFYWAQMAHMHLKTVDISFYSRVIPCQLIHFFADPSPILMKFGKLGGQQKKQIHTKFQLISTIFNGVRAL